MIKYSLINRGLNHFKFKKLSSANSYICCIDDLYLTKEFVKGVYTNTFPFCVSFIVSSLNEISIGKATNYVAWAANCAAVFCGFAVQENSNITDGALVALFISPWKLKMGNSSCKYGSSSSCNKLNCAIPEHAILEKGFF